MLGIFPLPWTPLGFFPSSCKNGRQQLSFTGGVGCLPARPEQDGCRRSLSQGRLRAGSWGA